VSRQAAGNLLANLAGEIAKLRAVKITDTKSGSKQQGILEDMQSGIGDLFKGLRTGDLYKTAKDEPEDIFQGYPAIGQNRDEFINS